MTIRDPQAESDRGRNENGSQPQRVQGARSEPPLDPPASAAIAGDSSAKCRLYTVQEAAIKLNLPSSWLYERTRKNAVPCRRFGKYVRFSDADLDAIIAGGRVSTNAETE